MIASTEQIVRSIRNCGEQLIKDAEQIAGNFYAPLCLDIRISLDLEQRAIPRISVDYEYTPEAYLRDPKNGFFMQEKPAVDCSSAVICEEDPETDELM